MDQFSNHNIFLILSYFLPLLLVITIPFYKFLSSSKPSKNKPPSPPKLPIIGNLHQLTPSLHRSLLPLSQRYGDLMLLHLGSIPTLIVSSALAARAIFKTHDLIFSSRPNSRYVNKIVYDCKDVAFAPYGEGWRLRRSICVMELLSNKKVLSFRAIREQETSLMVEKIRKSCSSEVNLSELILQLMYDIVCRASIGYSSKSESGLEFKGLLNEAMELIGAFRLRYFIPWLEFIDWLNGMSGRVEKVAKKLDEIVDDIVQECKHRLYNEVSNVEGCEEGKNNAINFVEILVQHQRVNKDSLSVENIKAMILDMFAAGSDTTFTVIDWTMSELILHPKVMSEVRKELRKVLGENRRKVSEDDLENLTYLKVVVKESLRLHPPGPLLIFRKSTENININGYDIDAGTQVIINAWAIQRDPSLWEEPEEFQPERFLNKKFSIDTDFRFVPFGGGRRICPGISFSMVAIELVLANLISEFDWKLPKGVDCENFDMSESVGLNVHKKTPLMVIATPT